jgi:uncharacterized protein (TIGR02145 family)
MHGKIINLFYAIGFILFSILSLRCGTDKSVNPSGQLPILSTAEISNVRQFSANCGGTIDSEGTSTVIARGVCWSTNPTPTIADSKTIDGAGIGSFESIITGLSDSTPYYVRAYATNGVGTGYGDAMWFTTLFSHNRGPGEPVTDIDGNLYYTVILGSQIWMAENLKTTHFQNGDSIPIVNSNTSWNSLTTGAYCNYNNDTSLVTAYGRLYNWYAVDDTRDIAPAGWHVASDSDWQILIEYLGGEAIAGGAMKDTGSTYWGYSNVGATNESGFTGRGSGCRDEAGNYGSIQDVMYLWSSTEQDTSRAWGRTINSHNSVAGRNGYFNKDGFAVRCVKD